MTFHIPEARWEFDDTVTKIFDDMLARSIPDFYEMRTLVSDIAASYNPKTILDLGCSRGGQIAMLQEKLPEAHFLGIDCSAPMVDASTKRFAEKDRVEIKNLDLRREFPVGKFDCCLSVLTLQFVPIEYRLNLLKKIYDSLNPGGVFILVEKILGASVRIDELLVLNYLDMKKKNGYSKVEIDRKRLSLEGVLVPVTDNWNRELCKLSGFSEMDCFWRYLNFSAYVSIKD